MGYAALLAAALNAVKAFFGWKTQRDANLNTPEIKANEEAAQQLKRSDENNTIISQAESNDPAALEALRRRAGHK